MLRRTRPLLLAVQRPIGRPAPIPRLSRPSTLAPSSAAVQAHRRARFSTGAGPLLDKIDRKHELEVGKRKLEVRPDEVTTESSTRHVFEAASDAPKQKVDTTAELKQDINTVKSTFALNTVPSEPFNLGLAGTLPYLATSVATVYLSWDLNQTWPLSNGLLNTLFIQHETAEQLLGLLEPIQLGYGAVIISFLGAIHWGMEWADSSTKPPSAPRAKFRYSVGLLAPAIAWPTLFLPVNAALVAQFAAFTGLYFVDTRAASRGWAPTWYGTYRFVLTFVVGSAIVVSLVGRAKIEDKSHKMTKKAISERLNPAHPERDDVDWVRVEQEDKEREKKEKEEAEKKKKREAEKEKKKGKGSKNGKKESKDAKKTKAEETDDEDEDDSEDSGDESQDESEEDSGDDEDDKPADKPAESKDKKAKKGK